MSTAVSLLRRLRTPLGQAYRTLRAPKYRRRATRILADFARHHAEARAAFVGGGGRPDLGVASPADVGVRIIQPNRPDPLLTLPRDHDDRVAALAREVDARFARTAHCTFFPAPAGPVGERTADLAGGDVIIARLKDPLAVPGLDELAAPLFEQIERRVYGSWLLVDKIYVYRSLVGHQEVQRTWLWHYDNHPREILKLMIYLTDVTETTAPFQYLRDARSRAPVLGAPLAPLYGSGRVPADAVERHLAHGAEVCSIVGPRGTTLLFDHNVVHRAVLPKAGHRDVLVFQVRPATFKARPFADARWTGSFEHADFPEDPAVTAPSTTKAMVFQR